MTQAPSCIQHVHQMTLIQKMGVPEHRRPYVDGSRLQMKLRALAPRGDGAHAERLVQETAQEAGRFTNPHAPHHMKHILSRHNSHRLDHVLGLGGFRQGEGRGRSNAP